MFSSPAMSKMDELIFLCLATRKSSWRICTTAVAVLTLPQVAQPWDAILSTYVRIFSSGAISLKHRSIWRRRMPSSKSLIMMSHLWFSKEMSFHWVVVKKGCDIRLPSLCLRRLLTQSRIGGNITARVGVSAASLGWP